MLSEAGVLLCISEIRELQNRKALLGRDYRIAEGEFTLNQLACLSICLMTFV